MEEVAKSIPPLPDEDHTCHDCGIAYSSIRVNAALEVIRGVPTAVADSVLPLADERLRRRPDAET